MKRCITVFIIGTFLLLLGACSEKNDLTTSELITKFKDHIKNVESHSSELNIKTEVKDLTNDVFITNSLVTINVDMIEPTIQVKGKKLVDDHMTAYYTTDQGTYLSIGEDDWENVSEKRTLFKEDATFYADTAQTILDLKDLEDINISVQDNSYILTFQGKSNQVYEAFKEPFNIDLVDINPEDMDQDMTIKINKNTFVIKEISNTLTTEVDNMSLLLSVNKVYDQINEIDEIIIPQGIIDEAK